MNLGFQVSKHLACHMARWRDADPQKTKSEITRLLKTGQAWLWPEPKQLTLWN